MPLNRKERTQIIMLIALLIVLLGALGYFYRNLLLPTPTGGAKGYTSPLRILLPNTKQGQDLFQREDFKKLHQFGSIPVKAVQIGPSNPFK
jgi:hypothetical protein